MARRIEHSGEVVRVDGTRVSVRIEAQGACVTCRAREACGMGESKEKIVEVYTPHAAQFGVGEAVTVGVARRMGVTAVVLAYVVPFFFLIGALAFSAALGIAETIAAVTALGAVAAWYLLLWLGRRKVENTIHFTITKR